MADDRLEIVGTWTVKFKHWTWEYVCMPDGGATWRDPLNGEHGAGRWSVAPKHMIFSWNGSSAKESWNRPIQSGDQKGWYVAPYGVGALQARKVIRQGVTVLDDRRPDAGEATEDAVLKAATQKGDYANVDVDAATRGMEGPTEFLGLLSVGFSRWLEVDSGGRVSVISRRPEGVPLSMDFLRTVHVAESKRLIVLRQGWSIQTSPGGPVRDVIVEIWWKIADDKEFDVLRNFARQAETGQVHAYGLLMRPAAGDEVLVGIAKREFVSFFIQGSFLLAHGLWRPGRFAAPAQAKNTGPARPTEPAKPAATATPAATGSLKPVNGTINVGGGHETPRFSNLNPINPNSGGPSKGIPNHVLGGMEDMDKLFKPASANTMISSRLRYGDVDWSKGTAAAARVMKPGGKVAMNVWCQENEAAAVKSAFEQAGFKNVKVAGSGVGTMIFAER